MTLHADCRRTSSRFCTQVMFALWHHLSALVRSSKIQATTQAAGWGEPAPSLCPFTRFRRLGKGCGADQGGGSSQGRRLPFTFCNTVRPLRGRPVNSPSEIDGRCNFCLLCRDCWVQGGDCWAQSGDGSHWQALSGQELPIWGETQTGSQVRWNDSLLNLFKTTF